MREGEREGGREGGRERKGEEKMEEERGAGSYSDRKNLKYLWPQNSLRNYLRMSNQGSH